jgi:hypothetical protein
MQLESTGAPGGGGSVVLRGMVTLEQPPASSRPAAATKGAIVIQKSYVAPTENACTLPPKKQLPAASWQSVVMPWPLAPRS